MSSAKAISPSSATLLFERSLDVSTSTDASTSTDVSVVPSVNGSADFVIDWDSLKGKKNDYAKDLPIPPFPPSYPPNLGRPTNYLRRLYAGKIMPLTPTEQRAEDRADAREALDRERERREEEERERMEQEEREEKLRQKRMRAVRKMKNQSKNN